MNLHPTELSRRAIRWLITLKRFSSWTEFIWSVKVVIMKGKRGPRWWPGAGGHDEVSFAFDSILFDLFPCTPLVLIIFSLTEVPSQWDLCEKIRFIVDRLTVIFFFFCIKKDLIWFNLYLILRSLVDEKWWFEISWFGRHLSTDWIVFQLESLINSRGMTIRGNNKLK